MALFCHKHVIVYLRKGVFVIECTCTESKCTIFTREVLILCE